MNKSWAFGLLASLVSLPASAEFYVSAFGGVGFPTQNYDVEAMVRNPDTLEFEPATLNVIAKPGAGMLAGVGVGYKFEAPLPGRFRLELEGVYHHADTGNGDMIPECAKISPHECFGITLGEGAGPVTFRKIDSYSGFGNIVYESPQVFERVSIYAGGGIGVANTDFRLLRIDGFDLFGLFIPIVFEDVDKKYTSFAWQTKAGVSLEVSRRLELFVEGRYSRTSKNFEFENFDAFGLETVRVRSVNGLAGVRFNFN